jgi:hypothetical protein
MLTYPALPNESNDPREPIDLAYSKKANEIVEIKCLLDMGNAHYHTTLGQ